MAFPWVPLLVFAAIGYATLGIGGFFTKIDAWYDDLAKPGWTPPGAVIGVVWWTIFTLLAVSMALVWDAGPRDPRTWTLYGVYAANLVLNVGWSYLFFTAQRPDLALREIVALEVSILLLAFLAYARSPLGALLLAPYAAWVAFAGYLNWTIVQLNP